MKYLLNKILIGKDSQLSGLFALGLIALIALGCTCGKDFDLSNIGKNDSNTANTSSDSPFGDDEDSEMPGPALLKALVRETTADFAYAISTEDFSKIYEKASSDFKSSYTQEQMKDVFKDFTKNKRLLLPILAKTVSLEPQFSPEPSIRTEKGLSILVANGSYDTKPVPMKFEYEYVKRNDQWKMLKLIVNVGKE